MQFQILDNLTAFVLIVLAFITSSVVFIYVLFKALSKRNRLATYFLVLVFSCVLWTLTYGLRLVSLGLERNVVLLKIQYLPVCFVGLAGIFFVLVYTKKERLLKKYSFLLSLPPVISFIALLTNEYHHLFFTQIVQGREVCGPLCYFPHAFFSYLYIIAALLILIYYFRKLEWKIEKKGTLILISAILIPFLANILYLFIRRFSPLVLDWTPVCFTITSVIFAWDIFHYRLLDITSIALKNIVKDIPSGVIVLNLNEEILDANPTALKMLGAGFGEIKGKNFSKIISSFCEYKGKKIENLCQKIKLQPDKSQKEKLEIAKPKKMFISFTASSVKNKVGDILGYVYLLNDITKEKEIDRMKTEFVSMTAHELRTPLAASRWSLEMLEREDVGKLIPTQKEMVCGLLEANTRLMNLVEDLLEVVRIEERRLTMRPQLVSFEKLIDNTVEQLSSKIKEKGLKFVWKKPEKVLPKVFIDPNRIIQVLVNIIGNAVKYTSKGRKIQVKVEVRDTIAPPKMRAKLKKGKKAKKYILCTIEDSGMGIPEDQQSRIFSRFFRGRNVEKLEVEGTGLGLYITKSILDLVGGAIWFESKEGVGTTFYFTIPVK